jgi:cold shock CspA family protein
MIGHVTRKRNDRGFGFLLEGTAANPGTIERFFHARDTSSGSAFVVLDVGDEVEFDPMVPDPPEGPRAINVRRVERPVMRPAVKRAR